MRELLRSTHFVVTVDDDARLVRRTRTAARFESLADVDTSYEALLRALSVIDRARYAVLVDVREGPSRNDPEFEAAVARFHGRLYAGFRRAAVLVRSAAGSLQMRRFLASSGVSAAAFTDEAEAVAHLRAPLAK